MLDNFRLHTFNMLLGLLAGVVVTMFFMSRFGPWKASEIVNRMNKILLVIVAVSLAVKIVVRLLFGVDLPF